MVAGFKFLDKAQEISVEETVLLSDILPIPQSYLYEKYNIPQPEGDEAIARKEQHPSFVLPPDPNDPDDRKGKRPPSGTTTGAGSSAFGIFSQEPRKSGRPMAKPHPPQ